MSRKWHSAVRPVETQLLREAVALPRALPLPHEEVVAEYAAAAVDSPPF